MQHLLTDAEDENGNELVHHSSRGWSRDRDGWWSRPVYLRDGRLKLLGGFEDSCHAFWQTGNDELRLYCRNAKQKRALDNGRLV